MLEQGFHFAQPLWLWGLALIPLVILWLVYTAPFRRRGLEYLYADDKLLPYLTGVATPATSERRSRRPLIAWSLAWSLLILAMAGPRWDYTRINPFEPGADLVILLDISRSMAIQDVQPSRLDRAKQEIQDLVQLKPGIRIGLVAFATIAHVVTPITEDSANLLLQLPPLSTNLVRLQGSRLTDALDRADRLFSSQSEGVSHNILLITDGDFGDQNLDEKLERIVDKDIRIHVLGVGTPGGGPVIDRDGSPMPAAGGAPVFSRLDEQRLEQIAEMGDGIYLQAEYSDDDLKKILRDIHANAKSREKGNSLTQIWKEHYHWLVLLAMLLLLFFFTPGGSLFSALPGGRKP